MSTRGLPLSCAMLVVLACAGERRAPTEPSTTPNTQLPLEDVPHALLGSTSILFERSTASPAASATLYHVDGPARRSSVVPHSLALWPAISPDGRRIAFVAPGPWGSTSAYNVVVANVDGSSRQIVAALPNYGHGAPSWTPDGRILFTVTVTDVGTGRARTAVHLYRQSAVPSATDRQLLGTHLTDASGELTCPWPVGRQTEAPNGALLYACRSRLYRHDAGASAAVEIYALPTTEAGVRLDGSPVWSPDGTRIAFIESRVATSTIGGLVRVRRVNADGSGAITLATVEQPPGPSTDARVWNSASLCWTADGSRIVFTAPEDERTSHVHVMDADGGALQRLTSAAGVIDSGVSCSR